jgi:hypothetical protein
MKNYEKKFNEIMEFSISAVNLMNPSVQRIVLTEQFKEIMEFGVSAVNLMNPSVQLIVPTEQFYQEKLSLMTDIEVRLRCIRNVYINASRDNVLELIDDENEHKIAEKNMWSVLKHWDNL